MTLRAVVRDTHEDAAAVAEPIIERFRSTNSRLADSVVFGTADEVAERLTPFKALGTGDFLVGAMAPWDWESFERIAGEVAPQLR
jgi:alkanesulfonate monooxygenase SsuD/methylene tetrahydromethanopterin reductase-like flavin-dependent oxidoreductase (luciferase family)